MPTDRMPTTAAAPASPLETVPLAFLPFDGFEVVAAIVVASMLLMASKCGFEAMFKGIVPAALVSLTVAGLGMLIFGVVPG